MNPFQIQQALSSLCNPSNVIKYADGGIEIRLEKDEEIRKVLDTKELRYRDKNRGLVVIPVTVTEHPRKNTARGVITCPQLRGVSEEEIWECLSEQGVTDAKRIRRKMDGTLKDTDAIILSFSSATVPDKIKVGFSVVSVRPFVPDPIRCFKCQLFGHVTDQCKNKQRCAKCSGEHDSRTCGANPLRCPNCTMAHGA